MSGGNKTDDKSPEPEKPGPEKPGPEKPGPEKPGPEKPGPEKPEDKKPEDNKPGDKEAEQEKRRSKQRAAIIRAILATAALALVAILLIDWNAIVFEGSAAGTIDAELRGDPVQMESRVAGYITRIGTDDDQPVHRGQLLYEIEQDVYRSQVEQNQASLHQTQAQLAELDARLDAQRATIASQQAGVQASDAGRFQAAAELARQRALHGTEGGILRDYQRAEADARQNSEMVVSSQDQLRAAQAQLTVLQAQRAQVQAQLAAQTAQLDAARINFGYTRIVAPADGFVTARLAFPGTYVTPGRPLITFVPAGDVWAVANYREEQLIDLAVGQRAELHVDAFPRVTLHGHVQSLGPTSVADQSALPPERATGNFTKVVQRVAVKITLDPGQPLVARLFPGLSVEAHVSTR